MDTTPRGGRLHQRVPAGPSASGLRGRAPLAALAALAAAVGCRDTPTASTRQLPQGPQIMSVEVRPDSVELFVGNTFGLTGTARDASQQQVANAPVTWSSSDSAVATVSAGGRVLAVAVGAATVTARSAGASGIARVIVRAAPSPTSITLRVANGVLLLGDTMRIQAAVWSQYEAVMPGVRPDAWHSSDDAVVAIDAAGLVRAVGLGTATIAATVGSVRAEASLIVEPALSLMPASRVAAGARHSCALVADGAAYCWGFNAYGQLGLGAHGDTDVLQPTAVVGNLHFASIAAGGLHSCALSATGEAYCWGANDWGQLGAPSTENCGGVGAPDSCSVVPQRVDGAQAFAVIAPGGEHTCALTSDGRAFCWGSNAGGALGIGDPALTRSVTPREVVGGHRFVALTSGDSHSCGLTATGEAYCWGEDYWGQVGDGGPSGNQLNTVALRYNPRPVVVDFRFRSIAATGAQTCGITTEGVAHCWGFNAKVWHGDSPLPGAERNYMESTVPLDVLGAGSLGLDRVVAGGSLTCGLTSAGTAWCWGWDLTGAAARRVLPPETLAGGPWKNLVGGGAHLCGVGTDGALYCVGQNPNGQLGDGSRKASATPVRVVGLP